MMLRVRIMLLIISNGISIILKNTSNVLAIFYNFSSNNHISLNLDKLFYQNTTQSRKFYKNFFLKMVDFCHGGKTGFIVMVYKPLKKVIYHMFLGGR